jgi:pyruvate/2-oxoglutarate dehydrogenase complex dihydrolipoamide dehydrogenase (E3) component
MRKFNLTKAQTRAYLEYVKSAPNAWERVAGVASHYADCPLVRAYKYTHPEAGAVGVTEDMAEVDDHFYDLYLWQQAFVKQIDAVYANCEIDATAEVCLNALDKAHE